MQKSSLSFSTAAISQWSGTYSGQKFTVNAATLAALSGGPAPQGGNQTNVNSSIAYVSAFSCAGTTLPNPSAGTAFNMTYLNNGNGWGSVDIAMMQIPTAIVYGLPWSGTNATYDPYSGYWCELVTHSATTVYEHPNSAHHSFLCLPHFSPLFFADSGKAPLGPSHPRVVG